VPTLKTVIPDVVVVEQPGEEEVETINFDSPRRPLRQLRTINYANDDVLSDDKVEELLCQELWIPYMKILCVFRIQKKV